jgi:transposase-like protein
MSNFDNFINLVGDTYSFLHKTINKNESEQKFNLDKENQNMYYKLGQILGATKCSGGIKIQVSFDGTSSNYYLYKVSAKNLTLIDRMVNEINNLDSQIIRKIKLNSEGFSTEIVSWE